MTSIRSPLLFAGPIPSCESTFTLCVTFQSGPPVGWEPTMSPFSSLHDRNTYIVQEILPKDDLTTLKRSTSRAYSTPLELNATFSIRRAERRVERDTESPIDN